MSPELPPSRERKRTLLTTATNERLITIARNTHSLGVIDYLCDLMIERFAEEESIENQMALEYILFRQEEVFEINILKADFKAPDNEAIALEEAINEALFKPLGE